MSTITWDDGDDEAAPRGLTEADVQRLLVEGEAEVTPCLESALADVKGLRAACLEAGIPALVGAPDACGSGKCSTKAQLLVREEDVPRVQALLRNRWEDSVRALGVEPVRFDAPAASEGEEGELPCPACGTAAPLVEGACSDCGLQLE